MSTTPVSAEEQKYGPGQRVGRYWVRPNVVIDLSNNLMWERGSSPKPAVFSEGVNYCAASQLEGHDNWKVPSIKQLRTLFVGCNNEGYCGSVDWSKGDDCRHCRDNGGPGERGWYMASGVWRNPEYPWFWSATPHPDYKDYRWSVHFVSAYVNYYWPTETYHVRCVRAAQ